MKLISKGMMVFCLFNIMVSCTSTTKTPKNTPEKVDVLSSDYYMQFKTSEQRFAQLMCGRFTCYRKSGKIFEVNDNGDSIVVMTVMIGDINKDGVWIYKESFISNYPEAPLLQLFQKIERVSLDSLTLEEYRPKSKENKYIGYYKKEKRPIDMSDFISTGCFAEVKKISQTEFKYVANMCKRNRGDKEQWIDIIVTCNPEGLRLRSRKYSEPKREKETTISTTSLFYKRLEDNH